LAHNNGKAMGGGGFLQYIDLQPVEDFVRELNLADDRHLPFYPKRVCGRALTAKRSPAGMALG
jgi:hypothetical protein